MTQVIYLCLPDASNPCALLDRLKAAQHAQVRQYDAQGGSHGALGKAIGLTRATAQSRRLVLKEPPDTLEQWATGSES